MHQRLVRSALVAVVVAMAAAAPAPADSYAVDPMHAGVTFKISHAGLAWIPGRFNELSGEVTLDDDPAKCSFSLTIKTASVDTNMPKRDDHLRSPDFFNVKQFPAITFKSTAVKALKDGYEVTGDLTMHGVTKPVTFALVGGKKTQFPKGVQRTGFSTELTIKRTDFEVGGKIPTEMLGDEVVIAVSFEGTKK